MILAAATGAIETKITTTWPTALTYTARGDQIVAATRDKVRVFDLAGGSAADFTGECSSIELGAASRDRSVLVVGGERGAVCVYSIAKRARIAEYPDAHHYNPVASVSVSADGTSYATAGNDHWLQVWLGGKLVTDTPEWPKETHAIALVGNGNVVTAIDHTIAIARAATPRIATKALADVVNAKMIVPSNDGKRLAIRTDGALQIIGIDGKALAGPGAGHTAWLLAVDELPDGHVASIARDDRMIVWDGATPKRTFGTPGDDVWDGAIAARAPIAATTGLGPMRIYDLVTGKLVTSIDPDQLHHPSAPALSPDGATVLALDNDEVRAWSARTGQMLGVLWKRASNGASGAPAIAFSPDGAKVVIAGSFIEVYDLATRKLLRSFPGPRESRSAAVAADGTVAIGDSDREVTIYSADGAKLRAWQAARYSIIGVGFAGRDRVVTSSMDGSTALWRLSDGHELARVSDHRGSVTNLGMSGDGQRAITGGTDGRVIVYELR
jgi:WD40 repeat protein